MSECELSKASARGTRGRIPARNKSAANAEFVDQVLVTLLIGAPQIVEQGAALADKLEQPATRMIVLHVRLEVLGQIVDALGEDGDLHFRRASVSGLLGVLLDDFSLAAACNRHRSLFLS